MSFFNKINDVVMVNALSLSKKNQCYVGGATYNSLIRSAVIRMHLAVDKELN